MSESVPAGWKRLPLKDYIYFQEGPGLRNWQYSDCGIPFLNIRCISNKTLDLSNAQYISTKEVEEKYKHFLLDEGDIVLSTSGTIGRYALIMKHHLPLMLNTSIIRFRSRDGGKFCQQFLEYYLQSLDFLTQLLVESQGSAQVNVGPTHLQKVNSLLPPLPEQQKIASILTSVDALIESLEQLIAKKRQIKQGAMQELLTGKKRLPGFNGEWLEKSLKKTATLKARIGWQGLTTAEYLDSGEYYLVTGTDFKDGYIDWNNCHYVDRSRYKQDSNIQLRKHDVLVTKDGTIGKVALINHLPKPTTLNSGVFVIRPIAGSFHPEFFYYLLCSNIFTEFLNQLSAGSTINHLYQKDFVNFIYSLPATIEEQATIAKILSDMDTEIIILETKLTKILQLKQSMMRELLTGRIRLI